MSRENIVVLILALLFWAFSAVARWLKEEMGKRAPKGGATESYEWSPASEFIVEKHPERETRGAPLPPAEKETKTGSLPDLHSKVGRGSKVKRLGLGSPRSLQQGIILMAILGPCRALEPPDENNPW